MPQDGMRLMMLELLRRMEDTCTPKTRESATRLVSAFCMHTTLDYEEFRGQMIKQVLQEELPSRMLTCADVCSRMIAYAGVCWHMLTYADVC